MATLADTGSTDVNLNNPYQQAIANRNALNPAYAPNLPGVPSVGTRVPAQLTPAAQQFEDSSAGQADQAATAATKQKAATQSTGTGNPLIGANLVRSLGDQPQIPDDSTLNTPEQASPADQAKQQAAYNLQAVNHAISPKTAKAPKIPTEQQDVNAAMAPDQAVLSALPEEYKNTLAQLAPFIHSGVNTGNSTLDAADANVANTLDAGEGAVEQAISGLSKAGTEYEKTIPYQGIVQALLGQAKYNITYNNAQPGNKSDWNDTMNEIYGYLSGSNQSTNGLPPPATAAASAPGTPSTNTGTAGGGNA